MNGKPDIKITQDIQVVVAILRETIKRNPNATINLVNVGQIGSNKMLSQQQLAELQQELLPVEQADAVEAPTSKLMLPFRGSFGKALPPDYLVDATEKVLDQTEGYRYTVILKAILLAAQRKGRTRKDAAKWLGMQYDAYCRWLYKLDLSGEE